MPCHHLGILNSFGRISQPRVSAGLMLPKFDYLSVLWVWLPVCALSLMTCLCLEFDDLPVCAWSLVTCLCLEFDDLSVLGVWWPVCAWSLMTFSFNFKPLVCYVRIQEMMCPIKCTLLCDPMTDSILSSGIFQLQEKRPSWDRKSLVLLPTSYSIPLAWPCWMLHMSAALVLWAGKLERAVSSELSWSTWCTETFVVVHS